MCDLHFFIIYFGVFIIVILAIITLQLYLSNKVVVDFSMLNSESMRLPRVELGSIAWKAIILTVGLQTLFDNEETRRTSIEKIQVGRNYS